MSSPLIAGAAAMDITPPDSQFLYGYPHVRRYSQGIHDPLLCSALYLADGQTRLLFLATDIIFISKKMAGAVRRRITESTGIPAKNILISATHTHSGPITVNYISNEQDEAVPQADEKYISYLQEHMIQAAEQAVQNALPAKIGLAVADSTGIGTNRRDPTGPADHQAPVLMIKSLAKDANIACMLVCSMHPTVLHEDSLLISADFPGMARRYLQKNLLGKNCPVLHHTGPAGNQSPRHVTRANSFAEAERLGAILGDAVLQAVAHIEYTTAVNLHTMQSEIDLPRKTFPSVGAAQAGLQQAAETLQRLQRENADRQDIRTAECDWFGAEETLSLAASAQAGRLESIVRDCLPAEIQIFTIGPWTYVAWPGELFVEYALQIKQNFAQTFVISLANGELQGYVVTEETAAAGGYEAANALFSHVSGQRLVEETATLLKKSCA
jgi:neutral ceramidase